VTAVARDANSLPEMPGMRVVIADLASDYSLSLSNVGKIDSVVHLAQAGGWNAFPTNAGAIASVAVAATTCLAEFAVAHGAKSFVLASSGGIYGPSQTPILETAPIKAASELGFYLSAKAAAETLVEFFAPHIAVHKLRYFFIYGPGQRDEFLIARMLRSVQEGLPIRLAQGTGPRLNPIHVEDASYATISAIRCAVPVTANIAGPDIVNLSTIVDRLGTLLGRRPNLQPNSDAPQDYVADATIMSRHLHVARIGLETGLAMICNPKCKPEW
jgi:nucleoside-diphosphate-sugar epimerase